MRNHIWKELQGIKKGLVSMNGGKEILCKNCVLGIAYGGPTFHAQGWIWTRSGIPPKQFKFHIGRAHETYRGGNCGGSLGLQSFGRHKLQPWASAATKAGPSRNVPSWYMALSNPPCSRSWGLVELRSCAKPYRRSNLPSPHVTIIMVVDPIDLYTPWHL